MLFQKELLLDLLDTRQHLILVNLKLRHSLLNMEILVLQKYNLLFQIEFDDLTDINDTLTDDLGARYNHDFLHTDCKHSDPFYLVFH